jgi:hypothetical protein
MGFWQPLRISHDICFYVYCLGRIFDPMSIPGPHPGSSPPGVGVSFCEAFGRHPRIVSYPGIEVDDAISIAEHVDL